MIDSPLEELERLNERVITEWEQTQLRNALWKHRIALLSAAREAETLRKLDEWKSASTTRDVWIGRVQRETTWEVELAEGKERNVIRMHERLADAISAALNEWDSTDA